MLDGDSVGLVIRTQQRGFWGGGWRGTPVKSCACLTLQTAQQSREKALSYLRGFWSWENAGIWQVGFSCRPDRAAG
ncbi:MAG: hypothetical protein ACKPJJ_36515, partial [Planctomycetaceae bacterium]